jgi:hypothetical protein
MLRPILLEIKRNERKIGLELNKAINIKTEINSLKSLHENWETSIYHKNALKSLQQTFPKWEKALGIKWMDYLAEIVDRNETGCWVKEIASDALKS